MSWTTLYDGSALPAAVSPAWTRGASTTPTTESVSGGVLHIATTVGNTILYDLSESSPGTYDVVHARALLKYVTGDANSNIALQIRGKGKFRAIVRLVSATQISVETYDASVAATTTTFTVASTSDAFHQFDIRYAAGVTTFYWDGVLKHTYSGAQSTGETENRVFFGDFTAGGSASDSYWDYVETIHGGAFATHTVDAVVKEVKTATHTIDAVIVGPTLLQKHLSGKITSDDCSALTKFNGTGTSIVSGTIKLAKTDTADYHVARAIRDGTSKADFRLGVRDFAISADVFWTGANTATAGNLVVWQDASNYYYLSVANSAGGTSTLYSVKGGTKVSRATTAKGAADSTTKRVKFYRVGDTFGAVVDGQAMTEWTDSSSPLSTVMAVYLGAPTNGSGTSDNRFDNLDISLGNDIVVRGVPAGGTVRLYDSVGATLASASESSGIATLDCKTLAFPITGYLQVFTDSYTTPATLGRLPTTGSATDVRGGDEYIYDPAYDVISADAAAFYSTSQYGSHNGVITRGDQVYGVYLGWDNSVQAFQGNVALGTFTSYEVDPPGTILDMHAPMDIQVDSTGFFHIVYGGESQDVYYRKSSSAWDASAWGARSSAIVSSGGSSAECTLQIDQADTLHLLGIKTGTAYLNRVFHMSKTSGGSWSAPTTIADGSGGWRFVYGDAAIGKESSGQKSLHLTVSGYNEGGSTSADYKNVYYFRSTDAGATWKGLTGSAYSLPLTMTAGDLTAANHIYTGTDAYVTRLAVDPNGTTIHAVFAKALNIYQAYFQGTTSSGWGAAGYEFTSSGELAFPHLGAIEVVVDQLVYLLCNRFDNELVKFRSADNGSTWTPTVVASVTPNYVGGATAYSKPPQWIWPKLTPIIGADHVKVIWQARGSSHTRPSIGTGTDNQVNGTVSGEGTAALYIADVTATTNLTHTIDGIVKATSTATHTVDAMIASTAVTTTHTIDGVVLATTTTTHTIDALIRAGGTVTHTIDGIISGASSPVSDLEGFVLDGLDLNSALYGMAEFVLGPPPKRYEWIANNDIDGSDLIRDPSQDNRPWTLKVRLWTDTRDEAQAAHDAIVAKLEKAERNGRDGITAVWTPVDSSTSYDVIVLSGETTDFPVTVESGYFVNKPLITFQGLARPAIYTAPVSFGPVTASTPLVTLELPSMPGQLPAEFAITVTDAAGQARRDVAWGLEQQHYDPADPSDLTLDASDMTVTGYAGSLTTRSGSVGTNVVRVTDLPVGRWTAVCGLEAQPHVGIFRPRVRGYGDTSTSVRVSWRAGDGPYVANPAVPVPAIGWFEIDLGAIVIPPAVLGAQSFDLRVEAVSTADSSAVDVDVVELIPAGEGYGRARTVAGSDAAGIVNATDDFSAGVVGDPLNGATADAGGTWATSGATTDFAFSDGMPDADVAALRATAVDEAGPRFAILGATAYTDTEVALSRATYPGGVSWGNKHGAAVARYVDASNYAFAKRTPSGPFRLGYVLAGATVTLQSVTIAAPAAAARETIELLIYASGRAIARLIDSDGTVRAELEGMSTDLATGGALASGNPGFYDQSDDTVAVNRFYDSFSHTVPAAEIVAVNANRAIVFRHDTVLRQNAAGTSYGEPGSYRGGPAYAPCAGDDDLTSRLVIAARRADVSTSAADHVTDATIVAGTARPRFLWPA